MYTHIFTNIYIYIYAYAHMYAYSHIFTYIYMYIDAYTHMYAFTTEGVRGRKRSRNAYIHMHLCTFVYKCISIAYICICGCVGVFWGGILLV